MRMGLCGILAGAALASASTLSAAIVYDNGAPNQETGNEATEWVQAEDFVLAAPAQVASATFWTIEQQGSTWDGSLTWYLFADSGGQPGLFISGTATPFKQATGNVNVLGSFDEYRYDFNFPSTLTLSPGATYWLGLHLSTNFDRDEIYWETTSAGLGSTGRESDGGTFDNWFDNGNQHAFYLNSSPVPEPTSAVALLGTSALLFSRRMRKS